MQKMYNYSSLIKIITLVATTLKSIIAQLNSYSQGITLYSDPHAISSVCSDFGRLVSALPASVLYPSTPLDISTLIRSSYDSFSPFTVAARGHGHSVRGQAHAPDGVVVEMASLGKNGCRITVFDEYVDVGGEQLWIEVLEKTLECGLAPRSWTDYLYLTVGGTLSNAGVSGQAFRVGPQISNVYELDVVTGKGEMITCSETQHSDLFFAVLGGLGQFGIITRARIALEPAPTRVKWVRMIYTDFVTFTKDQEHLISLKNVVQMKRRFDYVEGSLLMDQSFSTNWRSSFLTRNDTERISQLAVRYAAIYCLEGSVYYDSNTSARFVDQRLELLLEELNFVPGFAFTNDVSYASFLNRVHEGELKLRSLGLWDVPHPWLNLFVPKSRIIDFDQGVFKGILKHNNSMGPILIYPMNKNKWDERMSAVIPEEEIFYSVGLLRSATVDNWEYLEDQNEEIMQFCDQQGIDFKQYLPHYTNQADWMKHFGAKWNMFVDMKQKYDPKAILAPGQRIFTSPLVHQHASDLKNIVD